MSKFVLTAFADEIDMDLKTQMDVLDEHDIKFIEMRGVNGKCVVEYSLDEIKEIKKQLDKRGFKISAIGSPIGKIKITDDFKPHLELFKHTVEIAEILEAKYIRMFSFFIPENDNPDNYKDEVIKRWKSFINVAKGSGIILLHENEKEIYGDTPERCLDLIKTLNCDYLKLIFDPANFVQCSVETYPYAFDMLKDYVIYFHIKDALYKNHKVVPSGYGDGRVKEILTEVYNRGYEGFLSLEPHLGNFQGFSELENNNVDEEIEDSGSGNFAVAVNALKNILNEIEK